MAGPLLAQYVGGGADSMLGNLFLAFVAAVAFATIVAVVAGLVLAAASAMAHDLYVGVIREDHVTPQEQVRAARIATVDRRRDGHHDRHRGQGAERRAPGGAGVRGRVVGQLPVRAADAVLEALQHRRHRARHDRRHADRDRPRAGVAEHDLPAGDQGGAEKVVDAATANLAKLDADLAAATDAPAQDKVKAAIADVGEGEGARPKAKLKEIGSDRHVASSGSRSRGSSCAIRACISIPLGFLAVILGSLLYRDKRAEDMWDELYVRQNTGILAGEGRGALTTPR